MGRSPSLSLCLCLCFAACVLSRQGHTAEIVSLNFNRTGNQIITGSFDHTVRVWDVRAPKAAVHVLAGHHGEISSTQYDYSGDLCLSGSIDRTAKIWDIGKGSCVQTLRGHNDEILDVSFNSGGDKVCPCVRVCVCGGLCRRVCLHRFPLSLVTQLVTASADGTARVYNTMTGACQGVSLVRCLCGSVCVSVAVSVSASLRLCACVCVSVSVSVYA